MSEVGVLKPGTAIPTAFRGITYRSRLEANVAQFLLDIGLEFQYEVHSFLIGGKHYAPDFYLPEMDRYVEARGYLTETSEATLESFVRQEGDLFVFYYDKAEHIQFVDHMEEVCRVDLGVVVCDHLHASAATLGYPSLRVPVGQDNPCWLCKKYGVPRQPRRTVGLEIVVRSGIPSILTEIGKSSQGMFGE